MADTKDDSGDEVPRSFRGDVEGLRAVAVLPVLLFHFGLPVLPGGFVGVDIFFVISGLVIASGVIAGIAADTFTLGGFYARRARRILPALLATCLATAAAAWWLLLPPDFMAFGRSLIATLLSVSNIWFWKHSGYFAPESQSQPLLHCWSLAVEEQFYLFMPLAMMLAWRWWGTRSPRQCWWVVIVPVGMLSLAWCIATVFLAPSAGFYLLPSRAWELMLGAGVAVAAREGGGLASMTHRRRAIMASVGAGLIVASLLALRDTDVFPGWNALFPCVGAALIIAGGCGDAAKPRVNALLMARPLRAVGAISYSLYLVHWPIAAFANYRLMRAPTTPEALAMLAASLMLATASWRWIEQPFRHPRPAGRPARRGLAALAFGCVMTLGLVASADAGVMQRYPGFVPAQADAHDLWGGGHCFNEALNKAIDWDPRACARTHGPGRRILLWGDSFAAHYAPGLAASPAARGVTVLEYTFAGCPPIFAFQSLSRRGCTLSNAAVPALLRYQHIDEVVLAARWTETPRHTLLRLHETVAQLRAMGVGVVVIGQSPEFSADIQRIDYLSGQSQASMGQWTVSFDPAINRTLATEAGNALFVDPMAALCAGNQCLYRIGREWLFGDYGHYSAAGSLRAVNRYFPLNNPLPSQGGR